MKFETIQAELSKGLSIASRFVSNRAQLPVLTNIAINAGKNKVQLMATNLEISISYQVGAKISEEGSIAIPARTVTDLVANLSGETIGFVSENENLKIEAPDFSSRISGMNTNDFPEIPQAMPKSEIRLPLEKFSEYLVKVLFSVSRDDTRPVFTGVLFVFSKDKLTMVSSDGSRLSQIEIQMPGNTLEQKAIIPRTILGEIIKIGGGEAEIAMSINIDEAQTLFGFSNVVLGSRIIEGEFPPFENIIPKSKNTTVSVSREDLSRAIKTASVFARESANVIKLSVTKEKLAVSAESAISGEQRMEIPAKVEGESVEILFNYRFIEEFLGVVEGENVEIDFLDNRSPGVFRDMKSKEFFHLIMPLRPQE